MSYSVGDTPAEGQAPAAGPARVRSPRARSAAARKGARTAPRAALSDRRVRSLLLVGAAAEPDPVLDRPHAGDLARASLGGVAHLGAIDDAFEDRHAVGDRGRDIDRIQLELLGEALVDLFLDARVGTRDRRVASGRGARGLRLRGRRLLGRERSALLPAARTLVLGRQPVQRAPLDVAGRLDVVAARVARIEVFVAVVALRRLSESLAGESPLRLGTLAAPVSEPLVLERLDPAPEAGALVGVDRPLRALCPGS